MSNNIRLYQQRSLFPLQESIQCAGRLRDDVGQTLELPMKNKQNIMCKTILQDLTLTILSEWQLWVLHSVEVNNLCLREGKKEIDG